MKRRSLSRKAFDTWLAAKPDGQIVGYGVRASLCPITRFIVETRAFPGARFIAVVPRKPAGPRRGYISVQSARGAEEVIAPEWINDVGRRVDERWNYDEPVRAGELRELLA